ncbi:MAG: SpvB/TcaC N-terminal domain-containing protein, partial [Promethearchaeota archaeon]
SWLICESYDDRGNAILYEYAAENENGVDFSKANESNRTRTTNRYIKRIKYGNRKPLLIDTTVPSFRRSHIPKPDFDSADWMFEVVFDYNENHYKELPPDGSVPEAEQYQLIQASASAGDTWSVRPDPFSNYRAGFEVRTYRRCHRVLMFHNFPELGNEPYLVCSTEFNYSDLDYSQPIAVETELKHKGSTRLGSFLQSITQSGYVRNETIPASTINGVTYLTYIKRSLPPLELVYSQATINEEIKEIDSERLENMPFGLDGVRYKWVDLDGEGLSGVLTEQAETWFYKPNLGGGKFGPMEKVAIKPSLTVLNHGSAQLLDLAGDGQLDVAVFDSSVPGFYERTHDKKWGNFIPFNSLPKVNWNDPNLKFVDLTGDGHADVMITEHEVFTWYQSLAEEGFGSAEKMYQSLNEEKGPRLVFDDGTQSIYLSDLSGDGSIDLVRIRNGEVCYWPNLGYGRFGAKVIMDVAPWFDSPDQFDQKRVRLADVDGSGVTDIIYLGRNGVQIYFNRSGNSWSSPLTLLSFPRLNNLSYIQVVDLLGNGTSCLVWSSPLPCDSSKPMLYMDLMSGQKPHLLVGLKNNMGAETLIQYASSTKFYLADKASGKPWVTRLPFPVHVVERVETYDHISQNRFVSSYSYHHGYFDGIEREFRGFGRIEQIDTEEYVVLNANDTFSPATNIDRASNVPPVLTKTWFHTGAYLGEKRISKHFEEEYYRESDISEGVSGLTDEQMRTMLLDDTMLPDTFKLSDGSRENIVLSTQEAHEACRALKGSILRQEIYALDGTEKEDRPYSVSERNYTIELLQPRGHDQFAVFFTYPREVIDFHYERQLYDIEGQKLADPRVSHSMTLDVDEFGNVLQSAAIGYGRRYDDPNSSLTSDDKKKQKQTLVTYTENIYTNLVSEDDAYRTPLPCEMYTYQLLKMEPDSVEQQVTNLFRFNEIKTKIQSASDGLHDIEYKDWAVDETNLDGSSRRLIEHVRTLYRKNNLSGATPFGELESLALPYDSYKLAFTPSLMLSVYQRRFNSYSSENLLPDLSTVLCSRGNDGGGYVDMDEDSNWWIPSGRIYYDINADPENPALTSGAELAEASQSFFLPRRFIDPFGHGSTVTYDQHNLLLVSVTDAANNVVYSENDYRVLQPKLVTDPNDNRSQVVFDALGTVVGKAVMGKEIEPDGQQKGDSLDKFKADLTQAQINEFIAKPREPGANSSESFPTNIVYDLLREATSRFIYDLNRFMRLGKPPFVATIVRETHNSDLRQDQRSKLQISFSFSDGLGREIQKKIQAEPGPLTEEGIIVSPRWVCSGWLVFNNKGDPVKKYEPFFDDTHEFRFGIKIGVSPTLFYDAVGRLVATLYPNHTYEKVVFDPWHQETWDVNDTTNPLQVFDPVSNVLPDHTYSPVNDPDVGEYFKRLSPDEFLPTWYDARMDASKTVIKWPDQDPVTNSPIPENAAVRNTERLTAMKTAEHTATPGLTFLDSLGRSFLTIADNGLDSNGNERKYKTRVELDIQGNQREVTDAIIDPISLRGRVVAHYDYDMIGTPIHRASMEGGERWILNDVLGKPIRSWDSRGHNFWMQYDALRRLLRKYVRGTNANHSDKRTFNVDVLFEKITYGEGQANDVDLNLRAKVFASFDGVGIAVKEKYDFKGNLLQGRRELAQECQDVIDWSGAVETDGTFYSSTIYDALNRPIMLTTPDNSVIRPAYNEANLLNSVDANMRGEEKDGQRVWTHFVKNIEYNPKGQRTLISYGNGVETRYRYDPETFRLLHLYTRRGIEFIEDCGGNPPPTFPAPTKPPHGKSCGLQNIHYTYDPVGNITAIRDDAQQTIFFDGQIIKPGATYTYDAIYRLVKASGREHIGQASQPHSSWNDKFRVNLDLPIVAHPNDAQKMRNYYETYEYDDVGNILALIHKANSGNWIRAYHYNEASALENNRTSNRLSQTVVHPNGNQQIQEQYSHDLHGNIISMPHLQHMEWDFKDQLCHVDKGTEQVYYAYDATGQRVRKVAEKNNGNLVEERIYLGFFEVFQRRNSVAEIKLEREALHIMDDKQRIALVETRTHDNGSDIAPQQLIRYQLSNHLGSASLELDGQAQIISYEEYTPYGSTSCQAMRSQTETPKRYRYTGEERDEESGLYYLGARYYASWLGKWTACDPEGPSVGINAFEYSKSNPVNLRDPRGTQPEVVLPQYSREFIDSTTGRRRIEFSHEPYPVQETAVSKQKRGRAKTPKAETGINTEPVRQLGRAIYALGKERQTYANAAAEMSKTAKAAVEAGVATEEHAKRSAHAFRRAIEKAAREKTPAPIRKKMETRNIKRYGDPLGPSLEELSKKKTPMEIVESAGKTSKRWNTVGKAARIGGKAIDFGGKALGVAGSAFGGYQIGSGINQVLQGDTAMGVVDIAEGTTNVGLTIYTTAGVESGAIVAKGGVLAGGAAVGAGLLATGSVALGFEETRRALRGEKTAAVEATESWANLVVRGEKEGGVKGFFKQAAGWTGGFFSTLIAVGQGY